MKLGDVLRKERERKKISLEEMASKLEIPSDEYAEIEAGSSPAEKWGPLLAKIAIKLETPTSRLLADSGKSADCKEGQAGGLIRKHRTRRQKTVDQMAEQLEIGKDEYEEIEGPTPPGAPSDFKEEFLDQYRGQSGIEKYGPLLLHFAEIIEQPVFNLFYPCGLPLEKLDDYP